MNAKSELFKRLIDLEASEITEPPDIIRLSGLVSPSPVRDTPPGCKFTTQFVGAYTDVADCENDLYWIPDLRAFAISSSGIYRSFWYPYRDGETRPISDELTKLFKAYLFADPNELRNV